MRGRIALAMILAVLCGRAKAQDAVAAATEKLDRAFEAKSETDAVEAIRQAAKTVDPKVIQLIAKGLRVKSPSVNAEAMKALGSMRHPAALKALHDTYWWAKRAGLMKKNDELFALLLKSIGRHGDPSSLRVLTDSPFKHLTVATATARLMGVGNVRSREAAGILVDAGKSAGSYGRRSRNFQDWKGLFDMPYRVAMTVLTGNDLGASRKVWQD
ncbi:MAG: HEAT repeat domain-containing protein, partial [Planctomycetota bacterium]